LTQINTDFTVFLTGFTGLDTMKVKTAGMVGVVLLAAAAMMGCEGDKEAVMPSPAAADAPVIEAPAAPDAVAAPVVPPAAARGRLTVRFETSAPVGGKYAHKNIHAVWVETADGTFVRTLNLWADKRARHLAQWAAATADRAKDIQARTGATLTAYGVYTSVWDGTDAAGAVVPDGDYAVRLELTNDNANKNHFHRAAMTFTKGAAAVTQGPADEGGYKQVTLTWEPEL
jgi:hypothetical protein